MVQYLVGAEIQVVRWVGVPQSLDLSLANKSSEFSDKFVAVSTGRYHTVFEDGTVCW